MDGRKSVRTSPLRQRRALVALLASLTLCSINGEVFAICADGTVDVGEQCDDGGACVGGSRAGTACSSESECADGGACFGGLDDLRACESDQECRLGRCLRCRPRGGDGCAANCTVEAEVPADLVEGVREPQSLEITFGTSGGTVFSPVVTVPFVFSGRTGFTVGSTAGGVTPVTIAADALRVPAVEAATIFCLCLRAVSASTCGGTLFEADGSFSPDCTADSPTAVECPAEKPCAAVHGAGNAGSGFLSCGATSLSVDAAQDCNGIPEDAPFLPRLTVHRSEDPPAGTEAHGLIGLSVTIGMSNGQCRGTAPSYGPDGEFCTADDPVSSRGSPRRFLLTTGSVSGIVENPGDFDGDILGPHGAIARPFSCNESDGRVDMQTGILSTVFTECDLPTVYDIVVPLSFALTAPRSPTPSVTPTFPTPTPTRTSTRTWTPTPRVFVEVSNVAPAETRFSLDITLGGEGVAGVQHDILFDNTILDIDTANCRINPAIGLFPLGPAPATSCLEDNTIGACKSLAILKKTCGATPRPDGCPEGAPRSISVVTALIAGTAALNNVAMPEGRLYSCEAELINSCGVPTTIEVTRVVASDGAGRRIPARAVSGTVGGSCPPPTFTRTEPTPLLSATPTPMHSPTSPPDSTRTSSPTPTATRRVGDDGCSIGGPANRNVGAWPALCGLAVLGLRWLRRRPPPVRYAAE